MLSVKRPTPTTVLYTVSTRAPAATLRARLWAYTLVLLRVVFGIAVLSALAAECEALLTGTHAHHQWLSPSILPPTFTLPWRLGIYAAIIFLTLRRGYASESLLVIRGLGVQTTASSSSYLWSGSTRFIPTSKLQDAWIHEAFRGFEVRFYLGIVVEGEGEVVVVFPVSVS